MLNNMGWRCIGTTEIIAGSDFHGQGACTLTDRDGDQIIETYEVKGRGVGTSTLVAGTGKFVGISGTSEWTRTQYPIKADDKFDRGINSEKVHWKIE
jgi:hypothetical protein